MEFSFKINNPKKAGNKNSIQYNVNDLINSKRVKTAQRDDVKKIECLGSNVELPPELESSHFTLDEFGFHAVKYLL